MASFLISNSPWTTVMLKIQYMYSTCIYLLQQEREYATDLFFAIEFRTLMHSKLAIKSERVKGFSLKNIFYSRLGNTFGNTFGKSTLTPFSIKCKDVMNLKAPLKE